MWPQAALARCQTWTREAVAEEQQGSVRKQPTVHASSMTHVVIPSFHTRSWGTKWPEAASCLICSEETGLSVVRHGRDPVAADAGNHSVLS